jgi:deoxyadenosine/deoxycytidine kinase
MQKLVCIVGASGVGKTSLVRVLSETGKFATAYEQHVERPFQLLFKNDARYALANQMDYLLLRAEQERTLRAAPRIGLMDGGLDLDFHGFTRLFLSRGLLTGPEHELCRRLYNLIRESLPGPELIVRLWSNDITVAGRLSARERVNIARAQDTALFNSLLDEWIDFVPSDRVLNLDVTHESLEYEQSKKMILERLGL